MKKINFLGIAVCASLIAASCEKQDSVAPESPYVQEEVSFEDLTKAGLPELEAAYNDVNAAVNDISVSVAKQLGGAIYNLNNDENLGAYLLEQFTCFSSIKDSCLTDMYKFLTEIGLQIKNANELDATKDYITVDFENNQLIYKTKGGYAVTVRFPEWKFNFTLDEWPKLTREGNSIIVELSKTTSKEEKTYTLIASAEYELFNEGSTGNAIIIFYGEGKAVSTVSFSFNKSDMLIDKTTFVARYNNTEGKKGESNTSIKMTNPDVLNDVIDKMDCKEYSFEEAAAISDDFNANVVDDNELEPYAYIVGRYFRVQPVLNDETGKYEVRAVFSTDPDFEKYRLVTTRTLANFLKRIVS